VASWLAWLVVLLLAFKLTDSLIGGLSVLLLIGMVALLRPSSEHDLKGNNLLNGSIILLVGIPFVAWFLGSPSAMAFMRTSAGTTVLIAVWVINTAIDFRLYRKLPPTRRTASSLQAPG